MNLSNNKILITGGGSGIGLAMAERFIQEGNTVIICGRRQEALDEAAAKLPALITRKCDVGDESQRQELKDWIATQHSDLNVLINNAGIQNWMSPADPAFYQKAKQEIAINIEAPIHLTTLLMELPALRTIMNVTSGLSFLPYTKVPVYSATKAFLHSLTVSLQYLLKSRNIEVIEIIPPALNTDLGGKGLHDHAPAVSEFITAIFEQLAEGKKALTFGFTTKASVAGQEVLEPIFNQLNPAN
ncbi:SDR family oxidoreductase [Chitinophaga sp. Hz27]|uniref:SDR family oxidoreductase n=1 Tax=Chitinophaga sp. Hz27 TaxID=3347169 RepID=UPI0035E2D331